MKPRRDGSKALERIDVALKNRPSIADIKKMYQWARNLRLAADALEKTMLYQAAMCHLEKM